MQNFIKLNAAVHKLWSQSVHNVLTMLENNTDVASASSNDNGSVRVSRGKTSALC